MGDLYPLKKSEYSVLKRGMTDDDRGVFYQELFGLGLFTGLQWTLSAEPLAQQLSIPVIEDLLTSDEYLMSECSGVWLRRSLVMSSQVIETVAQSTVGQRSNPLWNIVRKHRITASNFGPVLQAIRCSSLTKSLLKRLSRSYNIETVRSIAWGVNHELDAAAKYRESGGDIEETGIWLHESGVLGASPDGMVRTAAKNCCIFYQTEESIHLKPDIIEIKYPYSAREMTILEAVYKVKHFP